MSDDPRRDDTALLDEYARLAPSYDTRWSFYVEATVRETLTRLEPAGSERVLDIGCGTGALLAALHASHPGLKPSGIDPSPEMLDVARARLGAGADLRQARAESLPFDDVSFDVAVSSSVFHYIRDPMRALAELLRVLVPGGRVVITDWCHDYLACRLCGLYLRLTRRPFARIYRSAELKRMLEETGFTRVDVKRYKVGWLWGLMTATATRS